MNLVYRLRPDGTQFVAVDREPSLDLGVNILRISGLTEFRVPTRAAVNGTGGCPGGGCGTTYRASDIRNAYLGANPFVLQNLDGTGQVVGLLELNSYNQLDVVGYDNLQIPKLNPTNVVLFEIAAPPPFTSYQLNNEVALDIEMVQAMAPKAKILIFQTALGVTLHGDAVLHAMATSNPPLNSASSSFEFGRSDNAQQALQQMAANGISFFNASMDFGDVGDPQSNLDMLPQTLVGGTFLNTNPLVAPWPNPVYPAAYYAGEATWNGGQPPKSKDVTGGGIMNGQNHNGNCFCWPYSLGPFSCCGSGVGIPDWQLGLMQLSSAANSGSTTWRNYPDVALLASNIEVFYGGTTINLGGTSAASPLWAGYVALINQLIKALTPNAGLVGFINPTIYDIGLTSGTAADLYKVCFNDIIGGNNANGFGSGFTAVKGYDLCTGLGTPQVGLIFQIASPTPLTPNQPLALIRFVIQTGDDDAGGGEHGSEQTADVFFLDGTSHTFVLRTKSEPHWHKGSTHTVDFQIPTNISQPLTPSHGLAGVRINLVQSNPDIAADNWDIATLAVSLFDPPFGPTTSVCQLNLIGTAKLQDGSTGLVRLSKNPGSSGVGPSSPVYPTGPTSGCP